MQGTEASPLLPTGTQNEMQLVMGLVLALVLGRVHIEGVCTDDMHYYYDYFLSGHGFGPKHILAPARNDEPTFSIPAFFLQ